MADPIRTPQTGDPTPPAPAGTAPTPQPATVPPVTATQEVKIYDADYVKDLRAENASYRTKAKDWETKATDFEKQISTFQQQSQTASLRAAVAVESIKLKIVDADAALALMDKAGISFGDDGSITGVEDALKKLIESKKYLVGEGFQSTPEGNPQRNGSTFTKESIAKMSADEINVNWDEVQKVLSS
jgi:Phage minor structural protein GP20